MQHFWQHHMGRNTKMGPSYSQFGPSHIHGVGCWMKEWEWEEKRKIRLHTMVQTLRRGRTYQLLKKRAFCNSYVIVIVTYKLKMWLCKTVGRKWFCFEKQLICINAAFWKKITFLHYIRIFKYTNRSKSLHCISLPIKKN